MAVNIDFRVKNGLVVTTTATIEGTTQSTSTNTGVLQVTGGAGIGKNLYVGGTLNVDNTANSISTTTGALQVSGGVGIAKDLYVGNDIRLDGIFYGTIIGSVTTATNLKDGTIGQIPYQSNPNVTEFFGPGVEGQLLVSAGTTSTGPVFTNTASIYVGYSLYSNSSTNISFGSSGSIPIQSSTGKTSFIPIGSSGNILVAGSNTATWVSTSTFLTAFATTATNILGGTVGQIPFQTATNRTSFVGPGTSGQILVSAGATSTGPVFQNTLTLAGNTQATSVNSGALQVTGGAGIGGNLYVGNTLTVLSTLSSTSSVSQNALYVVGGVGIGSSLYVTGPAVFTNNVVFSGSTTNVLSSNTVYTDNIIELHYPNSPGNVWGVNDGKDIGLRIHYYDTQDRSGFLGRNNSDGVLEWIVNSSNDSISDITGIGGKFKTGSIALTDTIESTDASSGTFVVAGGAGIGGNLYVGGTIYGTVSVSGTITTATNLYQGNPGEIPYQIASGQTSFISTATPGFILISSGTDAPLYVSTSSIFVGQSAIANNILNGNAGQLIFQTTSNVTSFVGTGTSGQILVSSGSTSTGPVFTDTGTLFVGYATSASVVRVSTDNISNTIQYITFVSTNTGYTSIKTYSTGINFVPSTGYVGIGITTATTKLDIGGGVRITGITTITNTTNSSSTTTGALQVAGGAGIGKNLKVQNDITSLYGDIGLGNNVASASTSSFALHVNSSTGYLEFLPNVYSSTNNTTSSIFTLSNDGSATTTTNALSITNATSATSSATGALTVTGGVGVRGDMYIGGTIYGTLIGSIVGGSTTATNLANGIKGQIPIQSSTGTTAFIGTGNTNNLLQYNSSTNTATWVSTSTIFVGLAASAILATNVAYGTTGQIHFQSAANKTAFSGPGTAGTVLVSAGTTSTGPVFQNTLTLAGITASSNTTTGALQVRGGVGIGGDLYVGGTVYASTFDGLITNATTATNLDGGTQGQVPYQSGPGITSFSGPGSYGQLLMSSGASVIGPIFTNTNRLAVGTAVTSTNIAGGILGSIPYQTSAGRTAFIGIGTNGFVLTSNGTTATWQSASSVVVNYATTATNIKDGTAGQLVYQTGPGASGFAGPGTLGQLLMSSGTSAPLYVGTSSVYVGYAVTANNIAAGTAGQLHYQSAAGTTAFVNTGTIGTVLVSNGTGAPAYQNTLTLVGSTQATTTNSGALQVVGGVGIGGNLVVGGTISGTINGTINGTATTATNIEKGSQGQIPIQSSTDTTAFISTGSTGNLLQYDVNTATWVSTSNIIVSNSINSVNSNNLTGGDAGSIPIQSSNGVTSYIPIGTSGFILTANGTTATWTNASASSAGTAVTATNLALGTVGQVPYQVSPGSTGFVGPGTTGTILVSAGDSLTGPVFTSTSNIYVGYSTYAVTATHITAGTQGQIHYQSNPGRTAFTGPGTAGTILVSAGTTSTGPVFQNTLTLAGTTAASSTGTGALQVRGGVGIAGDLYVGGAIYGNSSISGSISTATNIANGTAGQLHYQSAPGITGFVNTGTVGNVLVTNGTDAPSFNSSIVLAGNLGVNGGNITTTATAFNLINTSATTVNFAGEATTIAIGKLGGTTTVSGNLTVTGNWTVQGTTTIIDSTVTNISDPILILGGPANNAAISADDNKDKGIAFKWHDGTLPHTGFFGFDDSTGFFTFLSSATITNEITAPAGGTTKGAIDAYLAGGSAYSIHYQSSPNVTAFLAAGTAGQLLQTNGTGAVPTWVSPSGLSAANAANIAGGNAGQLVIQSGTGATSFVPTGGGGNLLQYDASNTTATWISTSSLRVGYANAANTANTATNIAGGSTGSVVYQSGTGTTAFLAATTSGYILSTQGTGNVPAWINPSASLAPSKLTVQSNITAFEYIVGVAGSGAAQDAYIANGTLAQVGFNAQTGNIALGTTTPLNKLHIVTSATASAYHIRLEGHNTAGIDIRTPSHTSGVQLAFDGSGGFQIKQSTTGLPIYFNMNGTTRFLVTGTGAVSFNGSNSFGTSGQYLQSAGPTASPTWVDASGVSVGVATTATNIAGGNTGTLLIQSGVGLTSFIGTGSTGNLLQYNGTNSTATWISTSTLRIGYAVTATTIASGTTGSILYQSGPNITAFLAASTSGYVLSTQGPSAAPTWISVGSVAAASATQVNTQQASSNATYYPTFVDSNNASATAESLYTTSSFVINPQSGNAAIGSTTTDSNARLVVQNSGAQNVAWFKNFSGTRASPTENADWPWPVLALTAYGNFYQQTMLSFTLPNDANSQTNGIYHTDENVWNFKLNGVTGANSWDNASGSTTPASVSSSATGLQLLGPGNLRIGTNAANSIFFRTSNVDVVKVDSSGNLAVNRALYVGDISGTQGVAGEIRATNEITAYYGSDARLKENITPIEDPIKMLEQIRGVYFDWTDEHIERRGGEDGYFVRKHDIGVIAQEVEAILPEIVATRDDGFKAVKYEKMVPLLIETIKAQQKQIDQIMATLKNLINK